MSIANLQRIPVIRNPNYKPDGLKSFAYLLNKFQFAPTLDGPFQMVDQVVDQGKHGIGKIFKPKGGKATVKPRQLVKQTDKATTTPGYVGAQDQQNDSMYLCPVSIGTPAQTLNLDFDSGSSDLWVWSTELSSSVQSSGTKAGHKIYNPAKSSTSKKMSGSTWTISYGDGSSASGDVYTDNVTVGGLTIKAQAVEVAKTLSTEFQSGAGDGLLGLAWGSINTVKPKAVATPVSNMITQSDVPKTAELFTAYLGSFRDANEADKGESFYTFGYIDQDVIKRNNNVQPYYTPVDNSQGFWQFASAKAQVNGAVISRTGNTAIADTGTTLLLTDDATLKQIYGAIPGAVYDNSQQGWTFPVNTSADKLPVVCFAVGDQLIPVQKEDLAFASVSSTMVYGAIQSRGDLTFDILGDTFLKGVYAIFDQGNTRFGVVPRLEATQNTEAPPS